MDGKKLGESRRCPTEREKRAGSRKRRKRRGRRPLRQAMGAALEITGLNKLKAVPSGRAEADRAVHVGRVDSPVVRAVMVDGRSPPEEGQPQREEDGVKTSFIHAAPGRFTFCPPPAQWRFSSSSRASRAGRWRSVSPAKSRRPPIVPPPPARKSRSARNGANPAWEPR